MAPEVDTQVAALRATGRLEVIAGRIIRAELGEDGIDVEIARRGRDRVETGNFARLIDCTGLAGDPRRSENPLLRALLASGAARTDPLGIGLDIDEDYALIDASSQQSKRVRAFGPLARAAFGSASPFPTSACSARTFPKGSRRQRFRICVSRKRQQEEDDEILPRSL